MNEYMQAVAQARADEAAKRAELERLFLELGHIPEYQAYLIALVNVQEAKQRTAKAETTARSEAEDACYRTGNKRPWAGVVVKVYLQPEYDPAEASEWAQANMPNLMMLDKARFDKAAIEGLLQGAPIKVVPTLKVFIDQDLSTYLG